MQILKDHLSSSHLEINSLQVSSGILNRFDVTGRHLPEIRNSRTAPDISRPGYNPLALIIYTNKQGSNCKPGNIGMTSYDRSQFSNDRPMTPFFKWSCRSTRIPSACSNSTFQEHTTREDGYKSPPLHSQSSLFHQPRPSSQSFPKLSSPFTASTKLTSNSLAACPIVRSRHTKTDNVLLF
jgi:hypothetical protein